MIASLRAAFLLPLLIGCASAGAAQAILRTPAAFTAGEHRVVGLHAAAIDGDRHTDLVIVTTHAVVFAAGTGDGSFVERQRATTDGETYVSAISEPAANGTRLLAVASAVEHRMTLVTYMIGAGDPEPVGSVSFEGEAFELTVADANGDDLPDVIGTGQRRSFVSHTSDGRRPQQPIWFSDPRDAVFLRDIDGDGVVELLVSGGSFTSVYSVHTGVWAFRASLAARGDRLTVADTNGDGKLDLIFASAYNFHVLRSSGANAWEPAKAYSVYPSSGAPCQIAVHDVNHDGIGDIIAIAGSRLESHLGHTSGAFRETIPSLAGGRPAALTFGDFDGDGRDDAAWFDMEGARFFAARGNGDGTFATHSLYRFDLGIGGGPRMRLFVTDLSSDSRPDVIAFGGAFPHIEGLRNDGHGRFTERVAIPLEEGSELISVADLDGDGTGDLVTANGGSVAIHPSRGDMTFAVPFRLSMPASLVGVADFNGDGRVDLLDAAGNVRLNEGNLKFGQVVGNPTSFDACHSFFFGDISGDGGTDVFCGPNGDLWKSLIHDREGRFRAPVWYRDGGIHRVPAIGDLNGDNRADLVAAIPRAVVMLFSRGDGTFERRWHSVPGPDPGSSSVDMATTIADFDGDGNADVAVGTTILLGDGRGSFGGGVDFDMGAQQVLTAADVDGNGSPDLIGINDGTGVNVLTTRVAPVGTLALPMQLTTAPNPSGNGQDVTVTARMNPASLQIPTVRVGLFIGGEAIGTAPVVAGKAVFRLPFDGPRALRTESRGDAHFADAVADATHNIGKGETRIFIGNAVPTVLRVGQTHIFSIAVMPNYSVALDRLPTGTLSLTVGAKLIGKVPVTRPTTIGFAGTQGRHELRFHYGGDDNYLPTTRVITVDVVTRTAPAMWAGATVKGAEVAIVARLVGDALTPVTGLVTFRSGDDILGAVPLSRVGFATLRLKGFPAGTHEVQVEYEGDRAYVPTSSAVTFTVQPQRKRRAGRS